MKKSNIILIGMPGAGKSTAGVLLAKALGYIFVDTDLLIQRKAGQTLSAYMAQNGMEAFLNLENQVLCEVNLQETVIATGGSAVFSPQGMANLQTAGAVIYLKISPQELTSRIHNIHTRGIVMKAGETLEELYAERAPLYEQYADATLSLSGQAIEDTVDQLTALAHQLL